MRFLVWLLFARLSCSYLCHDLGSRILSLSLSDGREWRLTRIADGTGCMWMDGGSRCGIRGGAVCNLLGKEAATPNAHHSPVLQDYITESNATNTECNRKRKRSFADDVDSGDDN